MKRIVLALAVFFNVLNLLAQEATLTQTIKGTVLDEQSGNVLAAATITVD
ncbi:MAG: hypothetical protein AAB221_01870 [Bacteroidota bacterium]